MPPELNPYQSPSLATEEQRDDASLESPLSESTAYRSARPWGVVARVGLGINLLLDVTAISIVIANRIAPEFVESHALWNWIDPLYASLNASRLAIAIPFLGWEYRSYRNLPALGHRSLDAKFSWVIVSWFVPIMNWFAPYQVMRELYRRSRPHSDPSAQLGLAEMSIHIWWAIWVLSALIGVWTRMFATKPETATEVLIADCVDFAYLLSAIVSAALAIYLVAAIDQLQLARWKFIGEHRGNGHPRE